MEMEWRIEMLGGLQLKRESESVEISKRGATRELLICLALQLGQSCSHAELIKRGWGKALDEGQDNLRHALPQLRRLLEPEGATPGSVLREQREKVSLDPERVGTDVADFLAACEESLAADGAAEQVERLKKAVDLYPGELLPGYDQPWIAFQRSRLADQYRDALRRLTASLWELGRLKEAKGSADLLFNSFPPEDEAFRTERDEARKEYRDLADELARRRQAASSPTIPADGPAPIGHTAEAIQDTRPEETKTAKPGWKNFLTGRSRRARVLQAGALLLLVLMPFLVYKIPQINERDRLYQEGRASWNERTEEGLHQSRADFARVIALDPNYAPGYAGLADADSLLGYYGWTQPRRAYEDAVGEAREATSRAQNDQERAEAHTSLAWAEMLSWNWGQSQSDFQEAFSADHWFARARQWHSLYLMVQGHKDQSLAEINQAVGRDPAPVIRMSAAQRYLYKGDYDSAVSDCAESLKEHPHDRLTLFWLGLSYEQERNKAEALSAFREADGLAQGRDMNMRAGLAHALAASGDMPASHQILTEMLRRRRGPSYVSPADLAVVYMGLYDHDRNTPQSKQALAEKEQALAWLERGYQEHAGQLFLIGVDPRFARLRGELRFADLLQKMSLPPTPAGPPIPQN